MQMTRDLIRPGTRIKFRPFNVVVYNGMSEIIKALGLHDSQLHPQLECTGSIVSTEESRDRHDIAILVDGMEKPVYSREHYILSYATVLDTFITHNEVLSNYAVD